MPTNFVSTEMDLTFDNRRKEDLIMEKIKIVTEELKADMKADVAMVKEMISNVR